MPTMEREARQVRKVHVCGCCRVRIFRSATARLAITIGHDEIATNYKDDTLVVSSVNPGTAVPRFGSLAMSESTAAVARNTERINENLLDDSSAPARTDGADITPLVDMMLQAVTRIRVAGAAAVLLHGLDQSDLDIQLVGSGHVGVRGRVGHLRIAVEGSGSVDASALRAWGVSVHLAGSGNVRAHATGAAMTRSSGPGQVVIFGHPPLRDERLSGGGDIHYR